MHLRKLFLGVCFLLFAQLVQAQVVVTANWNGSNMPSESTTFYFVAMQEINGEVIEHSETTDDYLDSGSASVTFNTIDSGYPAAILITSDAVSAWGRTWFVFPKQYGTLGAWKYSWSGNVQWVIQ